MDQKSTDQELAAYTDSLLDGQSWEKDRPPLAETVEILVSSFSAQPVPEKLRQNVLRQIDAHWPNPTSSWNYRLVRLFRRPTRQLAWGVMAAMIVLVVLVVSIWPPETGAILGTATGETNNFVLLLSFLVLAAGLGLTWYFIQKRKT